MLDDWATQAPRGCTCLYGQSTVGRRPGTWEREGVGSMQGLGALQAKSWPPWTSVILAAKQGALMEPPPSQDSLMPWHQDSVTRLGTSGSLCTWWVMGGWQRTFFPPMEMDFLGGARVSAAKSAAIVLECAISRTGLSASLREGAVKCTWEMWTHPEV